MSNEITSAMLELSADQWHTIMHALRMAAQENDTLCGQLGHTAPATPCLAEDAREYRTLAAYIEENIQKCARREAIDFLNNYAESEPS